MKNNLQALMQKNHVEYVNGKISKSEYETKRENLYSKSKFQNLKGK